MPKFTANPKEAAYCPLVPDGNSDCKLLIPCYLSVVVYRAYGVAAILLYNSYKYVAPDGVISCIAHGGDFLNQSVAAATDQPVPPSLHSVPGEASGGLS